MSDVVIHTSIPAPMSAYLRPSRIIAMIRRNRGLVAQFTSRDVLERHKGAYLGVAWNVINPLITLAIYTFVFGYVFKSRWVEAGAAGGSGEGGGGQAGLAFVLPFFLGHSLFHFFAECMNRAPGVVTARPNLVRKVVFPVEILPLVSVLSAGVYLLAAIPCLLIVQIALGHPLSWTALLLPVVMAPLVLLCMAGSWVLAAVGVFIRDLRHIIVVVTHLLMFLTPVFYPVERIPEAWRDVYMLNPMAVIVESARAVVLWGRMPDWPRLAALTLIGLVAVQVGYAVFMRARRGFSDAM
jgi:lipopolysaccharide transport system permease protein